MQTLCASSHWLYLKLINSQTHDLQVWIKLLLFEMKQFHTNKTMVMILKSQLLFLWVLDDDIKCQTNFVYVTYYNNWC